MNFKKMLFFLGAVLVLFVVSLLLPDHVSHNRNAKFNWDIPQAFAAR